MPGARLVVFGKQGAGKGTQCVRIARHYVVPHISTGDMFRAAVKSGSQFGQQARKFMDAGEFVPDDVVVGVVQERLAQDDTIVRGFVIDGFPRNVHQAEQLHRLLPQAIDLAIDLEVPTEVVLSRLAGRRVCQDCGTNYSPSGPPAVEAVCDVCAGAVVVREDDTEVAIRRRLDLYEEQTSPLVDWYADRGLLVKVDGLGAPDEVTHRLVKAIDEHRAAT